ncbi:MAG: aldose epimerase family protein [Coriobacteriia bacterium]|nr:aldose epimerase family protein [Coriobacteriia bacterium]
MDLFTIKNDQGMEASFISYGARLVSLIFKGKDLVLGFDDLEDYKNTDQVFGAVIGRYANRIGGAKFSLDGNTYNLPVNNGDNCLHGGPDGWAYKDWNLIDRSSDSIKFGIVSPDGDAGFPGEVNASVKYTITDNNELLIEYEATTTMPTPINMTNHAYFNLEGNPNNNVLDDDLQINAKFMTVLGDQTLPNGEIALIKENSPFDFSKPKKIGKDIKADDNQIKAGNGYDHNFIIDTKGKNMDYSVPLIYAASLHNPVSDITMDVYTTEPGVQFYDAVDLDGSIIGKEGIAYGPYCAACLETQAFPDSPNVSHFPNTILRPEQRYIAATVYKFS